MNIFKASAYSLVIFKLMIECTVFTAKESENQLATDECKTFFKQRQVALRGELVASPFPPADAAVLAGTFVFSSAWMVTENTLGWMEYQGKCDDSFLQKQFEKYKKQTNHNKAKQAGTS